jgi:hypothetical protein
MPISDPLGKFVIVAVPALAESVKKALPPPDAVLIPLPLLVIVAFPAEELSIKDISPPSALVVVPPLFMKLAPFEFEVSKKKMMPPWVKLLVPPVVMKLVCPPVPAVFVNLIWAGLFPTTKFCVIPELFVIPSPLRVSTWD